MTPYLKSLPIARAIGAAFIPTIPSILFSMEKLKVAPASRSPAPRPTAGNDTTPELGHANATESSPKLCHDSPPPIPPLATNPTKISHSFPQIPQIAPRVASKLSANEAAIWSSFANPFAPDDTHDTVKFNANRFKREFADSKYTVDRKIIQNLSFSRRRTFFEQLTKQKLSFQRFIALRRISTSIFENSSFHPNLQLFFPSKQTNEVPLEFFEISKQI